MPDPTMRPHRSGPARHASAAARLLGVLLLLLTGCRTLQVDHPQAVDEADWLVEGDSPQRAYALDGLIEPPLEEAWMYNAGAAFGPGSPLLLHDLVLVATRQGEIHAIDLETGKKAGLESFGDALNATPVVQDGRLFVAVAEGRRALVAYDLQAGKKRWRSKGRPIEAGLLLAGDQLLAVDVAAEVTAYAIDDGTVRWQRTLSDRARVHATPVLTAGGLAVLADDQGGLTALDPATGEPVWSTRLTAPIYTTPTTDGHTLYVPTTRGRFEAVDAATGAPRWTFAVPDTTVRLGSPALVDGAGEDLLVFGASDGWVRAVDPETGLELWAADVAEALSAPPLVTGQTVYAGTMDRMLYALDRATGAVKEAVELEGRIKSAMAAREGLLVVLAEPRHVYLFRGETTVSTQAEARR